jgi:hypothetical protein
VSPTPEDLSDTAVLQEALRAEHAAVYGYGYVGARSSGGRRDRCYAYLDDHRTQRDTLRTELVARDTTPDSGRAAYALPEDDGDAALDAYAAGLERVTAQAYLQVAASTDPVLRDLAARALQSATVRGLVWGAEPEPFPGFAAGAPPEDPAGG